MCWQGRKGCCCAQFAHLGCKEKECMSVFPVDQMCILQERDQLGGIVTPAQEDQGVGWGSEGRLEE